MRDFGPDERDAVLAAEGDAALGSAGAYRIEGPPLRLFARIEGDHFGILGLPLLPLLAALREVDAVQGRRHLIELSVLGGGALRCGVCAL